MKKFILVIILMVSIFLTGCVSDPETYYFDAADLIANTIKIELVECKNEKLEMIEVNEKSITNFDYNEVEPIDNLDNSQFESFIIELSSITFHKRNYSANIESVQKLIDGERHAAFPAEFREGMQCLTSILDYAYKNRRVCFIELCESSNVDAVGLIGELDRQTIMMYLYTECGQQDGEVVLDYEAISSVTVGGKLQDRIERLMKE